MIKYIQNNYNDVQTNTFRTECLNHLFFVSFGNGFGDSGLYQTYAVSRPAQLCQAFASTFSVWREMQQSCFSLYMFTAHDLYHL